MMAPGRLRSISRQLGRALGQGGYAGLEAWKYEAAFKAPFPAYDGDGSGSTHVYDRHRRLIQLICRLRTDDEIRTQYVRYGKFFQADIQLHAALYYERLHPQHLPYRRIQHACKGGTTEDMIAPSKSLLLMP